MVIGTPSSLPAVRPVRPPSPGVKPLAAAPAPAETFKVITFNTACGNSKITTNQADFPKLPFYRKIIQGAPDAPILCLQEVGNAQKAEVEKLAANGQFRVHYQRTGVDQGNMVLIPKRFEVQDYDGQHFGMAQVQAAAKSLWGWIKGGKKPNFTQIVEPRGFQELKLKDTVTGKSFTVINTHLSFQAGIQEPQAKRVFAAAHEAAKQGGVIVAGDLNVPTADTSSDPRYAPVRAMYEDFVDVGPKGKPPGKTNIDYVLVKGFTGVDSKWYTGDSLSLPGSPDARTVSDHYAEEDTLAFK